LRYEDISKFQDVFCILQTAPRAVAEELLHEEASLAQGEMSVVFL